MNRHTIVWSIAVVLLAAGCQQRSPAPQQSARTRPAAPSPAANAAAEDAPAGTTPVKAVAGPQDVDVLTEALAINSDQRTAPPAEFRSGHVTPRKLDADAVQQTETGFTVQLPSHAPVPTPTVYKGRLYVSGGFSSKEFYCLDADTGHLVWGVDLDDDGPSAAVASQGTIIFNTESCTIFALDADSGKMLWSHWLGDPLMSMPTVAGDRVFAVYPAGAGTENYFGENPFDAPPEPSPEQADDGPVPAPPAETEQPAPASTHVLACFELKTGKVLWQKWLDGDCISAPVATDSELYVSTFAGTVYTVAQSDGTIRSAQRVRATSAPVIATGKVFFTRRSDADDEQAVMEAIARYDRHVAKQDFLASSRAAPYLDAGIQAESDATAAAGAFEAGNGIGGGFGGGFGFGSKPMAGPQGFDAPGETPYNAANGEVDEDEEPPQGGGEQSPPGLPPGYPGVAGGGMAPADPLAAQQQLAAGLIGQGNVSTLQGFQGSRLLSWGSRNFNCMGNVVVCTSADSGATIWSIPLEGDMEKLGGHLAAPPVPAGGRLFLTTVSGNLLQVDPAKGKVEKRYQVGSAVRFPPAVENGKIYVGTQDGKVVCFDTGNKAFSGWPTWGGDAAHTGVCPADR